MTLEEEELAYYSEYGKALAAWALIEQALYWVAQACFPPTGLQRAMLGMGYAGIQGFRSKRLFVENVVTRGLAGIPDSTALQERWKEVLLSVETEGRKRNDLAHYITRIFTFNDTEGRRIALCPWIALKSAPKHQPPSGAYCVKDLIRTRRHFENLRADLLNFLRLLTKQEQLERPWPQPDDLPTNRQIADQIHEELGHPRLTVRQKRRDEDAANAAASLSIPLPEANDEQRTSEETDDNRRSNDAGGTGAPNAGDAG